MKPPSAGPPMIAMRRKVDVSAKARGNCASGTSAGTIACCAGICSARAVPIATQSAKMRSRPTQPA
jgi:hypothetical protein